MLTDVKVRQVRATGKPCKLTDSNGLYLEVMPSGVKHWRYRYRISGKENLFAIGDYPEVSLQEARRARDAARELVKQGTHPSHARKKLQIDRQTDSAVTFELVARE